MEVESKLYIPIGEIVVTTEKGKVTGLPNCSCKWYFTFNMRYFRKLGIEAFKPTVTPQILLFQM